MRLFLLVSFLAFADAHALTFQTRLEKVTWKVEGDQFECRLMQPITGFGQGGFVRRAGESARFRLQAQEHWFGKGAAVLVAAAAPWRQGNHSDIPLGSVRVESQEERIFDSSFEQAGRLLTGLMEGRSPLVRHRTLHGGDSLEVRLLPVRFDKAYADYQACTARLLPVNFDQVRQSQLGFSGGENVLDDHSKAQLERVLLYMKADPSVNHISLDGHSDNSGDRLTNRELSRQRALAVQSYLLARGIKLEQITLRFHGERYPLVPNNSKTNRAKNRRVTLSLERLSETPVAAPVNQAANDDKAEPRLTDPLKAPL